MRGEVRVGVAYRIEDHEAREEVEDGVKARGNDGGDLIIRRDSHRHHAVECEIQEREVEDEREVEEFERCPLQAHHRVGDDGVQ